jgi:hypothetical protein
MRRCCFSLFWPATWKYCGNEFKLGIDCFFIGNKRHFDRLSGAGGLAATFAE